MEGNFALSKPQHKKLCTIDKIPKLIYFCLALPMM
jgi:hypothetical protein